MARKGAKNAAATAAAKRSSASAPTKPEIEVTPAQPSLADELSATHQDHTQDGYESSTHTDNDDFEDAADGSHTDQLTPSSSAAATDELVSEGKEAKHETETADQVLSRPSISESALSSTPRANKTAFPDLHPQADSSAAPLDHLVTSSSTSTFVAPTTDDNITKADEPDTPLSSAEIRDSQSASDSLILDEEAAKATLPDHVEKVPPSVGATSMLEPEETISNPFASDDSSAQPINFSQNAAESETSAVPDTPNVNSNHFSIVSLGSGAGGGEEANWAAANRRDSRCDTITTNGVTEERSTDSKPDSPSNYDFLLARLDTQNKRLSGDPKQMRASIDGAVKLREHFEKLRDEKRHSRSDSQNRAIDQVPSSTHDANAKQASTSQGADAQRDSTLSSANVNAESTTWDGPPTEELGDEEIDWEFWGDVMSNYQQVARNQPRQLSRAIQAGIPPALRGMMWQLMSSSKNEEMEIIYAYYLKQTSTHEKAIRRDLNRTFPEQDYFQDGKGVGQENLFNVIKAYSLYDPEVGYCQGMQFVVGPLLLNMPDEEAFSTFVRLMKSYDLRGHFTPNMPALQLRLFQFDRLLEDFLPLLHRHLVRQGVKSSMYASQWFMTLFSYRFPLDFVYRILDSVFAEGVEALFRFAIALMKKNEERLLELNFDQAVNFLKMELFECYRRTSPRTSANGEEGPRMSTHSTTSSLGSGREGKSEYKTNEFVRDAFEIKITPFILDTYAGEFDVQVRAANAHRREVEALRLVNRNLSARVKALEEQLNSVNAEHVEMVKDVVMAKIAKEEMAEELVKYKMMYAEAVLAADQQSSNNRSSAQGYAAES